MKTINFSSTLAKSLKRFIAIHQASGTGYHSSSILLQRFDKFAVQQNHRPPFVTKELYETYTLTCSKMKPRYKINCLSIIRQFCCYLVQIESHCYLPLIIKTRSSLDSYCPYIIEPDEMSRLLDYTISLPPKDSIQHLMFTTIISLFYCTGVRVNEALSINIEDLQFDQQRLLIKQGKYHKSRWIYLSTTSMQQLQCYLLERQNIRCKDETNPLFISTRKRRLSRSALSQNFKKMCLKCNIINKTKTPRLLDLRHSFATQRLLQWYREGVDVQAKLSVLATHMGHVDIQSTQVYIHAIPELKQRVSDNFREHSKTIFHQGEPS